LANAIEEFLTVFRGAAGFRRDETVTRDLLPDELVGTDAQGIDGAPHGSLAQPTRLTGAFSQSNDPRKGIDNGKAVRTRCCEKETTIVGAEIEGAINDALRSVARVWAPVSARPAGTVS
jgi:hypothetical protein